MYLKKFFFVLVTSLFLITNLAIGSFCVLKSNKVHLRTGPGTNYPIKWILTCKHMPVLVTETYEHWKKITCIDHTIGWVNSNLLSNKTKYIITISATSLFKRDNNDSIVIANVANFCLLKITAHKAQKGFVYVADKQIKGWLNNKFCWGVK